MYLGYKIYTALCITKLAVHIQERKGMGSRPGQSTEAIQHITPIGKRKEKREVTKESRGWGGAGVRGR